MKYLELHKKRDQYQQHRNNLPKASVDSYGLAFDIRYTHDSTAMEGNTLSLIETKLLLEDQLSVGGKKLREIYEVVNHNKAYQFVKALIAGKNPLNEKAVKDIHEILMENIIQGGIYRNVDVYITGAKHTPPTPNAMFQQVKNFFSDLIWKGSELDDISLAAWTHAEFFKIHPFTDGNGRTSRLLMNYQLLSKGFLPVSIPTEQRLRYYDALESYANEGKLEPFADMIAELEEQQLDLYLGMIQQIDHTPQNPVIG